MSTSPRHDASPTEETYRERIATWKFLHDLFRPPSMTQWRWLKQDAVGQSWGHLTAINGTADAPTEVPLPGSFADFEQGYLAAFEVGLPHPPCPLIESHWNKREPLAAVLHENQLFYRRFGLELRVPGKETADHLLHQLEFIQYLCRLEAGFDQDRDRRGQVARARRDFVERHTGYWVPLAASALEEASPGAWPSEWMALLRKCCAGAIDDPLLGHLSPQPRADAD